MPFFHGVPNMHTAAFDAYFRYNPDDEGIEASQIASLYGLTGTLVGRIPHPAAKVVGAALSGASFGLKVGVYVKGDSIMMNNPYYNPAFAYSQRRIDFYP